MLFYFCCKFALRNKKKQKNMEYIAENATMGIGSDSAWLVLALLIGVMFFTFGVKMIHRLWMLNKHYHFITFANDEDNCFDDDED